MRTICLLILICTCAFTDAQIPVEVFGGYQRTSIDVMFFKFFKKKDGTNSRWLFFNRNRGSIDYRMTKTKFLPEFGFTEAISYNHEKGKGFAPVIIGQVLNRGVFPKAGIQYAYLRKEIMLFSWIVCETLKNPNLDYFLLIRYTPVLTDKLNLFTQAESLCGFATKPGSNFSFTQRLRLGFRVKSYQFGAGADFNQTGNKTFTAFFNAGGFIRHEF